MTTDDKMNDLLPYQFPRPGISDRKRQRDVFQFAPAFRDIPHADLPDSPDTSTLPTGYIPRKTADAPLAAFAQLAAFRLRAQRSLISLLDDCYQYILAEATTKTLLRSNTPHLDDPNIVFGSVRLPRSWGVCEKVLDSVALEEGESGIIIIPDLLYSPAHQNMCYVRDGPKFRFYAGVPLRSQDGSIVGALCVFDDLVRYEISAGDIYFLQDLAATVMDHLYSYTVKDQHRRAAEGLHGLLAFSEGDTALETFDEQPFSPTIPKETQHATRQTSNGHSAEKAEKDATSESRSSQPPNGHDLDSPKADSKRRHSASHLQERMLANNTKELFSQAAQILLKSSDMDGVMFVDASVAAAACCSDDPASNQPLKYSEKQCQILGFATKTKSSLRNDQLPTEIIPLEKNLISMLKNFPHGYSLECDQDEQALKIPLSKNKQSFADPKASERHAEHVSRVRALFPKMKSALYLPLWDFDRKRWFASCFCWSTRVERNLGAPLELPFLKAFSNSIMQEVARCDAINTDQTKTTFLSSLSHELRSPLHGILGSAQLLQSTALDGFQITMVNSINVCGRTLLETVQHLLDHAERKDSNQNYSTKTFPNDKSVRLTASLLPAPPSLGTNSAGRFCNVGLVTEEVVETMFLGEARFDVSLTGEDVPTAPDYSTSHNDITRRRTRFIILDIENFEDLDFSIAASSYGRLVMNLLGNALKFTESGYVLVKLRSDTADESIASISLRIKDSGIGMSREFLTHDSFEPFRKANQHPPGTGVGLNVVKRVIEDVGGHIEISSEQGKGTEVSLKLPVQKFDRTKDVNASHRVLLASLLPLKGRKVCVFHSPEPDEVPLSEAALQWDAMTAYMDALNSTLTKELKMTVMQTTDWDGTDAVDLVILPDVCFQRMRQIQTASQGKPPAILLIAIDTIEANTVRCDARIMISDLVVEVVTQPCGPFKLGMTIRQCLQRYDEVVPNTMKEILPTAETNRSLNGSPLVTELGPKQEIYSPLTLRFKDGLPGEDGSLFIELVSPVQSPPPLLQSLHPIHVLIVDDDVVNRRLLSAFVKKRKMVFKEACNGQQALDMYREANPGFDIILMDISMPVMDGMTSTRLIREHENTSKPQKHAHIIALTGLTSASAKLEAWSSGVDDFLTKPVDFSHLEGVIKAGRGEEGTGFLKE